MDSNWFEDEIAQFLAMKILPEPKMNKRRAQRENLAKILTFLNVSLLHLLLLLDPSRLNLQLNTAFS